MDLVYKPEAWKDLFVMLGGGAFALAGLMFLAVSLRLNEIVRAHYLGFRAASSIAILVFLVTESTVMLMPLPPAALGISLVVLSLLYLCTMPLRVSWYLLNRNENYVPRHARHTVIFRTIIAFVACFLGIAGGIQLGRGLGSGAYLIVLHYLLVVCLVFANSWAVLLASYEEPVSHSAT